MLNSISRKRGYDAIVAATALVTVFAVATASFSQAGPKSKELTKFHQCGAVKEFDPSVLNATCVAEAAAYASALSTLAAAQQSAEDAWEAWYACEYDQDPQPGGGGSREAAPQELTYSILDR